MMEVAGDRGRKAGILINTGVGLGNRDDHPALCAFEALL